MKRLKQNNVFKKIFQKETIEQVTLFSPIKGKTIPLENVNDEMFSQKMMGDGLAIVPSKEAVYAPFDGEIIMMFPSNHAIGIEHKSNVEMLIHIGIDTVNLNGQGFTAHVKQGRKVKKGDLLVTFDSKLVRENGYDSTVMIVCTKCHDYSLEIIRTNEEVDNSSEIITLIKK